MMLLLLTATLFGFLAFFEPCAIATHTLFSVRLNQQAGNKTCWPALFTVWLSRTVLLAGIFTVVVWLFDSPQWGLYTPSILLSVMAAIYLVSRFLYLPVPHLAFFKLIPAGKRLPYEIQLGLTLPACTLPLVIVIAVMAVTIQSVTLAIVAGLLFATLFTLPLVVASYKGLNDGATQLLNSAAKGSPYLTAFLLLALAVYLLVPALDINTNALKNTLQTASWSGLWIAFLAGFVFSFNPVSFASIPVMLAYVTKAHEKRQALLLGSAFVAGLIFTHVVLGIAAALGGEWVKGIMGRQWALLLGPILILIGLMWSGVLTFRLPWFGVRAQRASNLSGAFLLGIPFSVAICPFCAPAMMVSLTASASIGSASYGAALLFAFALGRSIPVLLGAWGMGWLESLKVLTRYQKPLEVTGGVVLVLSGLYLLNEYFLWFRFS